MDKKPNACRDLVVMPEGKGPLERSRQRWEDNINMDLIKQDGRAWTGFIRLRYGPMMGSCERNSIQVNVKVKISMSTP
jgi:hypothetical protein